MANILNIPFDSSTGFAQCRSLAANGIFKAGSLLPNGIEDRIWVENYVCNMYLNMNDLDTSGWKRTEIEFGASPTTFGEFWFTFDFNYQWDFPDYVVIGSIPVLIGGTAGLTYVPIGIRIKKHRLLIQAPKDLTQNGFTNIELASEPIQPGSWNSVCIHVNLQPDNTGFREVFLNGRTIAKEWNKPTTYPTASGHYFKLGPYDGEHLQKFPDALLLIKNVKLWTGNDGYLLTLGGAPKIGTRLIQP